MQNGKSNTANRELHFSRLLDAPVELVWEVWTNPKHIGLWWGPFNHYTTVFKMDVRAGGEWNITMAGADGIAHPHRSIFKEVVKYKKIVYEQLTQFKCIATIEFEKKENKTLLTWTMLFESREYLEQVAKTFGVDTGFRQNTERLVQYLSSIISES